MAGQAGVVVQLATGEQAAAGGDPSTMEFQLNSAVKGDPERHLVAVTRRVHYLAPAGPLLCL